MTARQILTCMLLLLPVAMHGPAAAAGDTEPLGIALEGYAFPHPVKFLALSQDGEDLRMAYMDVPPTGSPNGRTVVLLHGANFFGAYWRDTIAALAAAGYRVVVPDQVGFGKSSKPVAPYSFHALAANTKALLDALGIERAALVGHSMGGMLGVRFGLMYPDMVTHLVLENPIGLEDYRELVPWLPTDRVYQSVLAETEDSIRAFHRAYYVTWKPEFEELVQVHLRLRGSAMFPQYAQVRALVVQMIYEQPVVHELPLLRVPTLLVIGQSDRTAVGKARASPEARAKLGQYPELGRRAHAAIPGSRLVELPDVGHTPHLETPERFHAVLSEFLGQ